MKFRRNPKDPEAGTEMKQDFKLKCVIAEYKTVVPNKAYISCDIPKYSSVPVFNNEAYNVVKVPVLPNAESVCNVTWYSKSTKSQEINQKKWFH